MFNRSLPKIFLMMVAATIGSAIAGGILAFRIAMIFTGGQGMGPFALVMAPAFAILTILALIFSFSRLLKADPRAPSALKSYGVALILSSPLWFSGLFSCFLLANTLVLHGVTENTANLIPGPFMLLALLPALLATLIARHYRRKAAVAA